MESSLALLIAFIAIFLCGITIGLIIGITKGISLGASFKTNRPPSPLPWILCFIGSGALLLSAIGSAVYSVYFLSNSNKTSAMITEVIKEKNSEGHLSVTSVYAYKDTEGNDFTDRSSNSDGREFKVGDTIPIRYLRSSPHQSRIDYFTHHWFGPIFFTGFSVILAGIAIALRCWRKMEQQWASRVLSATGINDSHS